MTKGWSSARGSETGESLEFQTLGQLLALTMPIASPLPRDPPPAVSETGDSTWPDYRLSWRDDAHCIPTPISNVHILLPTI